MDISRAKQLINDAKHITVLTGAGVSAESGVPTFRDALTGLWSNFDPMQLATADAFRRDPALVWGWYEWRRKMLLEVKPNPAHLALAQLAKQVKKLTLITQNVDNLHEQAGSQDVLHLHGDMFAPRCFNCGASCQYPGPPTLTQEEKQDPPKCKHCNGYIRPGVVWFGEAMPEHETTQAFKAAKQCDVFLSIGTSGLVYPAAGLPTEALRAGATVIHINPEPMQLSPEYSGEREFQLIGKAGVVVPELVG